jgi:hypothetical protein
MPPQEAEPLLQVSLLIPGGNPPTLRLRAVLPAMYLQPVWAQAPSVTLSPEV